MSVLFDCIEIREMALRNRFVRSATYDGCAEKNGHVSQRQLRMFEELARGGVGLIITGITYAHPSGQISVFQNSLASDDCIPGFRKLAETVHNQDAKIAVQLFHAGRETGKTFKPQRKQAIAPSLVSDDPYFQEPHRAMTEDEIWEIVRSFGDASRRAREAGLDAVQLHAAHAYLLSQFLSPFTNRRADQWGGNLENRLRLHYEIYRDIRAKVGEDYPILVKIGVEDGFPGGLKFEEGKDAAQYLSQWGFDALEISSGLRGKGYATAEFRTHVDRLDREAYFRDWCREIRRHVRAPVMMVGGLRTFELMEQLIQNQEADFVSLCRPLIREPGIINDWKNKDRHRAICISCNKCFEVLLKGEGLHCVVKKETEGGEKVMDIQKVFIVGSGLMGSGIAQVCAQSGLKVVLYDIDPEALKKALKNIEWSVGKFVEKGELKEEKTVIMRRIKTDSDFSEAATSGLLIEAVFENLDLKKEIFEKMDALARPEALIASNTSSIPITEIAVATKRPERVLGLHFFSPVPMMQAVEVIRGQSTKEETIVKGREFVLRIGKEPIMVNRDVAGFVINRLNFPSSMEAMRLVEEGITTVEDIDKGVKLALGRKMGIFETSDMVGLDVTYGALMAMYKETGDPRWFPPMILRRKVKSGELGRKTGKGWYEYDKDGRKKTR